MKLLVDERDVKFVLYEQLHVEELCKHPRYQDFSEDMFDMAIEQAEKLAEREFYPTNRKGDLEGCRFEEGRVMVPECFHEPYRLYCEGGWLAISDSPEVGGQGFPMSIANACMEFFGAANWALFMYPGLTHGAARLLENYGSPKLKDLYLHKMF